jgi:hypothetical protein
MKPFFLLLTLAILTLPSCKKDGDVISYSGKTILKYEIIIYLKRIKKTIHNEWFFLC